MRSFMCILAVSIGAGSNLACGASALPVRVLHSDAPTLQAPERSLPADDAAPAVHEGAPAPRIGAPGGSGAGSRRVAPAQSGNDTVGGLPAGIGGGSGPGGRG